MRALIVTACAAAAVGLVWAATQTVDGKNLNAATYGAAVASQDTRTAFGDPRTDPRPNALNQMFVDADPNKVYIALSGNLGDDNAIQVLIDVDPVPGASTTLNTDDGSCPQLVRPIALAMLGNTVLDPNFAPDYAVTISVGKFPGQSDTLLVFTADLTTLSTLNAEVLGIGTVDSGNGILTSGNGVEIAIDDTNTKGVRGWDPNSPFPNLADPNENPSAAQTGIELGIPRGRIGMGTGGDIRVFAYLTNNVQGTSPPLFVCPDPNDPNGPLVNHQTAGPCGRFGFGSNQALPGLGGNGNLATFTPPGCLLIDLTGPQGPGTQHTAKITIPAP